MFKEVVVSSFHCPHCGASNSSIQSGAAIEPKGVKYKFSVQHPEVGGTPYNAFVAHYAHKT